MIRALFRALGYVPARDVEADSIRLAEYTRAIDEIAAMEGRYNSAILRARQAKKHAELRIGG